MSAQTNLNSATTFVPLVVAPPRTLAASGSEGAIQESSGGSSLWSGLLVAALFGGALYVICRSSRR